MLSEAGLPAVAGLRLSAVGRAGRRREASRGGGILRCAQNDTVGRPGVALPLLRGVLQDGVEADKR